MNTNRERIFKFRLTEEEYIRLKACAYANGVKPSEALRQMVNFGYDAAITSMLARATTEDERKTIIDGIETLRRLATEEV